MKLRNAEPDDYEPLVQLLEEVYGFLPGSFRTWWIQLWGEENVDWSHTYVVEEDGRLVSHTRVFPLDLVLDGIPLRVGGIGGVATHANARGKGYMSALLHHAIARMREEEFPLSVLWGDRHRYGAFGFELAGRKMVLRIKQRGLERAGIPAVEPAEFPGPSAPLAPIIAAYERHPYRRRRRPQEYPLIYARPGLTVLCHGEDETDFGYLVLGSEGEREWVTEFGGDARVVLGMARYRIEQRNGSAFSFSFPADRPIPRLFLEAAGDWSLEPTCMASVLDPEQLVQTLRPGLVVDTGLSEQEQVRALFGTWGPSPLNLFFHALDTV